MSDKRFEIRKNINGEYWLFDNKYDKAMMISKIRATLLDVCNMLNEQQSIIEAKDSLLSIISKENEQLRQVVEEYRKTNKHLSGLCADASKNGYLPPLEDL